jgi:protoporphyrinogen oxidase
MPTSHASHWGIIGGGIMGMVLARRLAERGQRVTVCESAPQLGGLTSAWRLGPVAWDRFYHVTLLSDTHLRALLAELGLERDMRWVETKTGFFTDGQLHSMSNTVEFLRFPPLRLQEKLRLGGTIWYGSKIRNWRRLERIPVQRWLQRWSGRGTYNKIWRPLLRAKLGDAFERVSAAFIWTYIARMYRARRTGMKKEMFGYVSGGYAHILERLAADLDARGIDVLVDHAASHVGREPGTGQVQVTFQNGERESFDQVILTTPAPLVSQSVPDLTPDEHRRLKGIEYLGVVCASLLLRQPLSPYYVTNVTDDWVPLTGVIEMTTIVDPAELGGHHLVYLPKYVLSTDRAVLEEPDDAIRERLLATLERMYPSFRREHVVAFQVGRARYVVAIPTVDYSTRLPPMKTSIPGVFVINSAHILKGNLNVNETIELGEEAFRNVLLPEIESLDRAHKRDRAISRQD